MGRQMFEFPGRGGNVPETKVGSGDQRPYPFVR
jgi:hypothetical protein